MAKIRNDNFCDCSDCADEVNWNCDTCGAFDGDDGEEATDVGSVRGWKNSEFGCQEGKRCGKRKSLVVRFLFEFVLLDRKICTQYHLLKHNPAEFRCCQRLLICYLSVPMICKNSTGLAFR